MARQITIASCGVCGCSDNDHCLVHGVECIRVSSAISGSCSACVTVETLASTEKGRAWMELVIKSARTGKHPDFVPSQFQQEENRRYEQQRAERRRQEKQAAEKAKRQSMKRVPKWAMDLKSK